MVENKCPHCNQEYSEESIADIFDKKGNVSRTPTIYICNNESCDGNKYQLYEEELNHGV